MVDQFCFAICALICVLSSALRFVGQKMSSNIPSIDFATCSLLRTENDITEKNFVDCGNDLYAALSTVGFAYLTNHGIPWTMVDELNEIGEKFYSLPVEVKKKFEVRGFALSYDSLGRTQTTPGKNDCLEGLRIGGEAYTDENIEWPDVPGLRECYTKFAVVARRLFMRIMKALGHGMKLKDRDYFCHVHSLMNQRGNYTTVKTIRYPPIKEEDKATENRIGEHTDRSTMTLLFQDNMGGLQVRDIHGNLVDVHHVAESIVINIGDTLEAWSGNRLKATRHRVTTPFDPKNRGNPRRSVVYFAQANQNVLMKKLQFDDDDEQTEIETGEKPLTVDEYMHTTLRRIFQDTI